MFHHQQLQQITNSIPSNVPIQQIQSLQKMQREQSSYAFQTAPLGYAMLINHAMANQNRLSFTIPPLTNDPTSMNSTLLPPTASASVTTDTIRRISSVSDLPFLIDNTNAFTSPTPVTRTSPAPVTTIQMSPAPQSHGFKCDQCGRAYLRKTNLTAHKKIHTDSAYVCDFCNKKFARKSNLQQHIRIHTDERPYLCTYCPRTFRQQYSLKRHLRTHTGEKPHRCVHCNKRFSAKWNLTVHLRTHTGDKPYKCAPCRKQYSSRSAYNVHARKCRLC
eukprot:48496_1